MSRILCRAPENHFGAGVTALAIAFLLGVHAFAQDKLRFEFIDDQGVTGSFVLDPSVAPTSTSATMTSYPATAVREFVYREGRPTSFVVTLYQSASLWGIHLADMDPSSDFNLRFVGDAFMTGLSADPADYRFVSGGHYTDRYGYRTVAALSISRYVPVAVAAEGAPLITTQPADVLVAEGETATFGVGCRGEEPTYQWFRDGEVMVGQTESRLVLPHVRPEDSGATFTVLVRNAHGEQLSEEARLAVGSFAGLAAGDGSQPPMVDGQAEEMWDAVAVTPIELLAGGEAASTTDLDADVRFVWHGDTLYVLVTGEDDHLVGSTDGIDEGDGVILMAHHGNLADATVLRVPLPADGAAKRRADTSGVVSAARTTLTGYTVEAAIALSTPATGVSDERYVYVGILIDDDDGEGVETVVGLARPDVAEESFTQRISTPVVRRESAVRMVAPRPGGRLAVTHGTREVRVVLGEAARHRASALAATLFDPRGRRVKRSTAARALPCLRLPRAHGL